MSVWTRLRCSVMPVTRRNEKQQASTAAAQTGLPRAVPVPVDAGSLPMATATLAPAAPAGRGSWAEVVKDGQSAFTAISLENSPGRSTSSSSSSSASSSASGSSTPTELPAVADVPVPALGTATVLSAHAAMHTHAAPVAPAALAVGSPRANQPMVTQPLPASVPANPPELPAVVAAPVHAQVAAAVLPALAVPVQPVLAAPAAMPAADAAARAQHMARLRSQFMRAPAELEDILSRIANCPIELRKPLLAEWEFKSNEQKARHAELDALALGDAIVPADAAPVRPARPRVAAQPARAPAAKAQANKGGRKANARPAAAPAQQRANRPAPDQRRANRAAPAQQRAIRAADVFSENGQLVFKVVLLGAAKSAAKSEIARILQASLPASWIKRPDGLLQEHSVHAWSGRQCHVLKLLKPKGQKASRLLSHLRSFLADSDIQARHYTRAASVRRATAPPRAAAPPAIRAQAPAPRAPAIAQVAAVPALAPPHMAVSPTEAMALDLAVAKADMALMTRELAQLRDQARYTRDTLVDREIAVRAVENRKAKLAAVADLAEQLSIARRELALLDGHGQPI